MVTWEALKLERCHVCDALIDGEAAGRGLLVFPRGDHVDAEEPALCEACSQTVSAKAYQRWWLMSDG